MKKVILAMALVAFAAANSFAAAKQAAKTMEFGVDAGIALPLSPSVITDAYGLGVGGGAYGRYIINSTTSIGLDATYLSLTGKTIGDYTVPSMGNFELLAQGKIKFGNGSARPYVLGGIGLDFWSETVAVPTFNYVTFTESVVEESVTGSDLMLQPGFGVEFGSKTKFFAEAKLSIVLTSGDTLMYMPVMVGVQF